MSKIRKMVSMYITKILHGHHIQRITEIGFNRRKIFRFNNKL